MRNERQLILTASADASMALWDIYGNQIGIFGQVRIVQNLDLFETYYYIHIKTRNKDIAKTMTSVKNGPLSK